MGSLLLGGEEEGGRPRRTQIIVDGVLNRNENRTEF